MYTNHATHLQSLSFSTEGWRSSQSESVCSFFKQLVSRAMHENDEQAGCLTLCPLHLPLYLPLNLPPKQSSDFGTFLYRQKSTSKNLSELDFRSLINCTVRLKLRKLPSVKQCSACHCLTNIDCSLQ